MPFHGLVSVLQRHVVIQGEGAARRDLAALGRTYARPEGEQWAPVHHAHDEAIAADAALAEAGRHARLALTRAVVRRIGTIVPVDILGDYVDALLAVPRERFVRPEDIAASADDTPLPLDRQGFATVSAPHAYLLTYALLLLGPEDHLVELGTGTGYGAALAREIVGPRGFVDSIEIDADLAARAQRVHARLDGPELAPVTLLSGDAARLAPGLLRDALDRRSSAPPRLKIAITFALRAQPDWLINLLPEGGCLVAPVGPTDVEQQLVRWERRGGAVRATSHGAVRYVTERH